MRKKRRRLPPVRPGAILREELDALELSGNALALAIRVPANRVTDIIAEKRAITVETALRLGRYFGTTAQFWLNLQTAYDLEVAELDMLPLIEREVIPHKAA